MTRIVTTHYRYKRPPGRKKPVALEVPAVVKAADPAKAHRRTMPPPESTPAIPAVVSTSTKRAGASAAPAANDDHRPAIVTARKPRAMVSLPDGLLPETPEEHQQRGDATVTGFRPPPARHWRSYGTERLFPP
jgi:hypothetical protein